MYTCILPYNGECKVKLEVDIHGKLAEISNVLLDTGFTSNTTFGLKLPLSYTNSASHILNGKIKQADGNEVPVQYIPNGVITSIESYRLKRKAPICTCFMTGPPILGVMFLQECRINFDGPKETTIFDFDF